MTGRPDLRDGIPSAADLGRPLRLVAVHAHPDDETLSTGVALAHHARLGQDVHVLTCTLGEEGEVIPAPLAHLEGAAGDPLAHHRRGELTAAMRSLGVVHHLLGASSGDAGVVNREVAAMAPTTLTTPARAPDETVRLQLDPHPSNNCVPVPRPDNPNPH